MMNGWKAAAAALCIVFAGCEREGGEHHGTSDANRWIVVPAPQVQDAPFADRGAWRVDSATGALEFCAYRQAAKPPEVVCTAPRSAESNAADGRQMILHYDAQGHRIA